MWLLLLPLLPIGLLLTPGLIGLLQMFGLSGGFAALAFNIAIVGLLLVSILNSRGTFKAREHWEDMRAGIATVMVIVVLINLTR